MGGTADGGKDLWEGLALGGPITSEKMWILRVAWKETMLAEIDGDVIAAKSYGLWSNTRQRERELFFVWGTIGKQGKRGNGGNRHTHIFWMCLLWIGLWALHIELWALHIMILSVFGFVYCTSNKIKDDDVSLGVFGFSTLIRGLWSFASSWSNFSVINFRIN